MEVHKVETGEDIRINMLVYGLTGVGKTTFLGSAQDCPATSPALLVDVEGGSLSLSGSDIDVFRPTNFTQIQELYDFVRFENTSYRSVLVDSITEIQRNLSMGGILRGPENDTNYNDLANYTPPDRYDWLSSGEQMRRFIRAFRDLAYCEEKERRVHVFFSALEKTDDVRSNVCPSLPGLLGVEIGASLDVLGRLSVQRVTVGEDEEEKELRNLLLHERTDDDGIHYLAKMRKPLASAFPTEMWNPTVAKVLALWAEGTKKRRSKRV